MKRVFQRSKKTPRPLINTMDEGIINKVCKKLKKELKGIMEELRGSEGLENSNERVKRRDEKGVKGTEEIYKGRIGRGKKKSVGRGRLNGREEMVGRIMELERKMRQRKSKEVKGKEMRKEKERERGVWDDRLERSMELRKKEKRKRNIV